MEEGERESRWLLRFGWSSDQKYPWRLQDTFAFPEAVSFCCCQTRIFVSGQPNHFRGTNTRALSVRRSGAYSSSTEFIKLCPQIGISSAVSNENARITFTERFHFFLVSFKRFPSSSQPIERIQMVNELAKEPEPLSPTARSHLSCLVYSKQSSPLCGASLEWRLLFFPPTFFHQGWYRRWSQRGIVSKHDHEK